MLAEKPPPLSDAKRLSQRVHFAREGTVSIASGKVELGQGILTALAQIAAEELDVRLERIRELPALMLATAAKLLRAPMDQLVVEDGTIRGGGDSVTYWELADLEGEIRGGAPFKPLKTYGVVGKSAPRLDLPGKFAGRPSYVQDMVLPGMLHGRVVRPSHGFSRLKAVGEINAPL